MVKPLRRGGFTGEVRGDIVYVTKGGRDFVSFHKVWLPDFVEAFKPAPARATLFKLDYRAGGTTTLRMEDDGFWYHVADVTVEETSELTALGTALARAMSTIGR